MRRKEKESTSSRQWLRLTKSDHRHIRDCVQPGSARIDSRHLDVVCAGFQSALVVNQSTRRGHDKVRVARAFAPDADVGGAVGGDLGIVPRQEANWSEEKLDQRAKKF
jgi:hypothetical protein